MHSAVDTLKLRFNLSPLAALAVEAAFANLSKKHGEGDWMPAEFSVNLTNWLIAEALFPVHVASEDFRAAVEKLAVQ